MLFPAIVVLKTLRRYLFLGLLLGADIFVNMQSWLLWGYNHYYAAFPAVLHKFIQGSCGTQI